jgi:hypothetical protein
MLLILDATLHSSVDSVLNVLYPLRGLPVKLLALEVEPEGPDRFRLVARLEGKLNGFRTAQFMGVPGVINVGIREPNPD